MNNINMTQQVETSQQKQQQQPSVGEDERLPEKVLEMYNMLLGITTELEKIKYQLAKRQSVPPSDGEEREEASCYVILGNKNSAAQNVEDATKFSFENLHEQVRQNTILENYEINSIYFRSFLVMVSPVPMELILINQVSSKFFFLFLWQNISVELTHCEEITGKLSPEGMNLKLPSRGEALDLLYWNYLVMSNIYCIYRWFF